MNNKNIPGKRYGLQVPKKPALGEVKPRLSVFADDSSSENEEGSDWVKKTFSKVASQGVQKKQTKLEIQRALKEDPTVYQYDEIYDKLEEKKQEAKAEKTAQERKPRYIQTLMAHAEKRKREQERRVERQVQKEREAEGEAFKDKESFITSSYRKKLEEFRIQDEEERRRDELEAIGDVSKQQDLSGFYRHLYCQKLGENKPTIKQEKTSDEEPESKVEKKPDEPNIKPSTSATKSDEDSNLSKIQESEITEVKEDHKRKDPTLPSTAEDKRERHVSPETGFIESTEVKQDSNEGNLDADTDISSTSSSSESHNDTENKARIKKRQAIKSRQYRRRQSSSSEASSSESESEKSVVESGINKDTDESTAERVPALNTSSSANVHKTTNEETSPRADRHKMTNEDTSPRADRHKMTDGDASKAEKENKTSVRNENKKTRKPDVSIYKKRTVGEKFEEARCRYLERKAERAANNIIF